MIVFCCKILIFLAGWGITDSLDLRPGTTCRNLCSTWRKLSEHRSAESSGLGTAFPCILNPH